MSQKRTKSKRGQSARPGPKPAVLAIEGNWKDSIKHAMTRGKPPATTANKRSRKKPEKAVTVDPQMMDDVPRILALSPEDRLNEVANINRFVASARPVSKKTRRPR